jgi:hypothetical protein
VPASHPATTGNVRSDPDLSPRQHLPDIGTLGDNDYDVFDGDRDVGRIYLIDRYDGNETWFWGLAFEYQRPGHEGYGRTESLEEAKATFRVEYAAWKGTDTGSAG